MPLADPLTLVGTEEFDKLPSYQQRDYIRNYITEQKGSDPTLENYHMDDLVDAGEGLITAKRLQNNAVVGPVVRGMGAVRGTVADKASELSQALGASKETGDMIGGFGGMLVDLPIGIATYLGTAAITKNPLVSATTADALLGALHATEEMATTGRKDVAAAQFTSALAAAPVGRVAAVGKLGMTPGVKYGVKEVLRQNAAELAVNLPGNLYGINTEKERGEAIGATVVLQTLSTMAGFHGARPTVNKDIREQAFAQQLEAENKAKVQENLGVVAENLQKKADDPTVVQDVHRQAEIMASDARRATAPLSKLETLTDEASKPVRAINEVEKKISEEVIANQRRSVDVGGVSTVETAVPPHIAAVTKTLGGTVPEKIGTINKQLKLLKEGKRDLVFVPDTTKGTKTNIVPEGFDMFEDGQGRYIFNPNKYSPEDILKAKSENRLGDLLGYGVSRKTPDADQAVTVRDKNGTEVQAVVTNEANKPKVVEAAKKVAGKEDVISVETPQQVLESRIDEFKLPDDLRRSAPAYKDSQVKFSSDYDRAAYIVAGKGKSKAHDKFVKHLESQGYDVTAAVKRGQEIRTQLKGMAPVDGVLEIKTRRGAPEGDGHTPVKTIEQKLEHVVEKFGYKIEKVSREDIAKRYKGEIEDLHNLNGFVDKKNRNIVLVTDGKSDSSMMRTLRHELGHIIYNPAKAAKILALHSDADLARLKKQFGVTRMSDLAEEIFSEATSRVLEREFDRVSAPLMKRVIYAVGDLLESMGIDVIRAARDSGYVADLKISKDMRLLINDVREAAYHVAAGDKYFAEALGIGDRFKFSRNTANLDPTFQKLFSDPKGFEKEAKNPKFWQKMFVDRIVEFRKLDDIQAVIEGSGIPITPEDHLSHLQTFHARASGTARALLHDPNAGNLQQLSVDLMRHPEGDLRAPYGQWRVLKRYEYLLTRNPRSVSYTDAAGNRVTEQVDTTRIKPIKIDGVEVGFNEVAKQLRDIETQVGSAAMQLFNQGELREKAFYNKLLEMQLSEGLIKLDTYNRTKDSPFYTPFRYQKDFAQQLDKASKLDAPKVDEFIQEIEGGMENPHLNTHVLGNAAAYANAITTAVEQNQVVRRLTGLTGHITQIDSLISTKTTALSQLGANDPKRAGMQAEIEKLKLSKDAIEGVMRPVKDTKIKPPEDFQRRYVFIAGERKAFDIDIGLVAAMDNMLPKEMNSFMKALSLPGVMVRLLSVSANWAFAARNVFRDIPNVLVLNPGQIGAWGFLKELPSAVAQAGQMILSENLKLDFSPQAMAKFTDLERLRKEGGLTGIQVEETRRITSDAMGLFTDHKGGAKHTDIVPSKGKRAMNLLTAPSEWSEVAVRLAVFKALEKKGFTSRQSAYGARSILDFERAGIITRQMNQIVPFLNARVQGISVMTRAITGLLSRDSTPSYRAACSMKLAVSGILLQVAMGTMQALYGAFANKGDDALKASDSEWAKNYMFPMFNGKTPTGESAVVFSVIPKPEFYQAIFNPVEQVIRDQLKGKLSGATAMRSAGRIIESLIPINIVDKLDSPGSNAAATMMQLFGPTGTAMAQWVANKEFYTGRNIVPKYQTNFNPQDQYKQSTLQSFRMLGGFIGESPAKLESAAKTLGFTGMPMRAMKIIEKMIPKQGPSDETSIGSDFALSTGFVTRGGFKDESETVKGEAFKSVNAAYQKNAAEFKRRYYSALQEAHAGDTGALKSLKREYTRTGNKSWVQQIDESLKDARLGQDRTVDMLRELSPPMRAASILEIESGLSGDAKYKFLRNLKVRRVMSDETASYYRRYKRQVDRGMDLGELGQVLNQTYRR